MKIGFDAASPSVPATYSQHLAKLLVKYAPQHEYVVDVKPDEGVDVYHSCKLTLPLSVRMQGARSVITVTNLNFLRYPHMYSFFDRMVRLRMYRYTCRTADCLITLNRRTKEELSERLRIDERKIKVCLPLAVHPPVENSNEKQAETIRRKYELPRRFVLMIGVMEPRHNLLDAVEAMLEIPEDIGLVICGRKTPYSDFLMGYARTAGIASRVEFVYEPTPADLPVLFRMAEAFVYIPDASAEASILPVAEALRSGIPLVLSDIPVHREAAADAAVYVAPGDAEELASALGCVLGDEAFRRALVDKELARAELFSEWAVAQRLIDIYSSL